MPGELVAPLYCLKCRRQIQGDATFCPYCGHQQGTRPDAIEVEVIDAEVVEAISPVPSPAVQPATASTIVVEIPKSNAAVGAALGAAGAIGLIALLTPPLGCITVPLLFVAVGLVLIVALAALQVATETIFAIISALWPMTLATIPALLCWRAAQRRTGEARQNLTTIAAGIAVIGVGGAIISVILRGGK